MPYNGVGIFTRVYSWVSDAANGLFIDATRTDTDSDDIANGLSNCVTRDGQSPPTADIPMGGFKLTGLASGAVATDAVNYGQVFTSPTFLVSLAAANATLTGNTVMSGGTVTMTGATTVTVPTPTAGDNSNNAASTAFAVGLSFAAALPAISAPVAYNFVTNDGAVGSWTPLLRAGTIRFADSADTTKRLAFAVNGVTTGTTRTITIPDKDFTAGPSRWEFLTPPIIPSAVAAIDFLSIFAAGYDNVMIVGAGITASATDTLLFRAAVAGVADTGSNYFNTTNFNSIPVTATSTSMTVMGQIINGGTGLNFILNILNVNDATRHKTLVSVGTANTAATPEYQPGNRSCAYTAANAMSGGRLYWSGGSNFGATGNIRIYGLMNS